MPPAGSTLARSHRTRAAIVDALLDLLNEGGPFPSTTEITERAGVSRRSLYVHFADLEALFDAAAASQAERLAPIHQRLTDEGDLVARLRTFVEARVALLEAITPVRRAALKLEPTSPVIAARLEWSYCVAIGDIERVFAPELAAIHRPAHRRDFVLAIDAATSWASWDHLRRNQGRGVAAARRVMYLQLQALFEIHEERMP